MQQSGSRQSGHVALATPDRRLRRTRIFRCFSNVTTSLCDSDAIKRFRYHVIDIVKNPVSACLAGTDGIEDSFVSMNLVHSFYRDKLIYAGEKGVKELEAYLMDALPEFTKTGSGDDVTISGFIDRDAVSGLINDFKMTNEMVKIDTQIRILEDRIKSINAMGKVDALRKEYENALLVEKGLQDNADDGGVTDEPNRIEQIKKKRMQTQEAYEQILARQEKYQKELSDLMKIKKNIER